MSTCTILQPEPAAGPAPSIPSVGAMPAPIQPYTEPWPGPEPKLSTRPVRLSPQARSSQREQSPPLVSPGAPCGEPSEHLAFTHLCLPVPSAHGPPLSPPLQDLAHSWPWQQAAWPELGRLRDFLVSQDQTHSPIKETAASPEETQLERRSQANCAVGPGPRGSGMGGLVRPLLYHSSLLPTGQGTQVAWDSPLAQTERPNLNFCQNRSIKKIQDGRCFREFQKDQNQKNSRNKVFV